MMMVCCLTAMKGQAESTPPQAAVSATLVPSWSMPQTLTLPEARRFAFERNWDLLAAKSDVDIAVAQRIVGREFPNPTFSWSTAKLPADSNPAGTSAGNDLWHRNYDTIFAINQLFEIGGKRSNRQASATAGVKAAEARLLDARRTLDLAVTRAYVTALLAQTNVSILRQSAEGLKREAKIAEARLNAGDISRADKAQIEIAADRLELDARAAETIARTARISVEVLLGAQKPSGTWTPADTLDSLALETSVAKGREYSFPPDRPDLLAAEALRQRAEADLKYQKALRIPDPTLLVQYEHEPPDQPNTIGFGLSFPLPLWNRNKGGILAARAAKEQAEFQLKKTEATITAEIASAEVTYADAAARWQQARETILPKSQEVRKTISFAYEKGGASLLDLLSAERNDNEVRLATAQAAADAANAAAALKAAWNVGEKTTSQHPISK
ncbi:MAG: Outer rane efflux protein [Verrucomicrobiales bacterium]|nr:Outer rane efflux protein [Verrucomicrobiales bacterium]